MNWAWTMAGAWLLPGVLGGGLLLFVALALALYAAEPARRQRLGECGVAAALFAVALGFGPRWLSLPLSPTNLPSAPSGAGPADVESGPAADDRVDPAPPPPDAGEWLGVAPMPEAEVARAPDGPPPAAEAPAASWRDLMPSLVGWLGAAHAAGAVVLLGRWLLGHVGLWRLLRAAEPVSADVADVCRSLSGGRGVPRLLRSSHLRIPLSCGLLRPTILLPAPLCDSPQAAALRWVLAHELTHLERRDVWGCVLFGLGEVVFYALPWFWWLRRQAGLCREYVADAAAAAQGGAAADYAQFLLNLAAAPAAPAGATGVTGHTSDLFRRVAMLLNSPRRVEKRPPRLWSLGVAAGLLSLGALVAGVGPRADAARADEPARTQGKKEEPKVKAPPAAEAPPDRLDPQRARELQPDRLDPQRARELQEELRRVLEQLHRQFPDAAPPGGAMNPFGGGGFGVAAQGFGQPQDGRLGVHVKEPGATLVDQLDLAKGQGVVLEEVMPNSAAAKAGLKANDILLELNGKPVSSNVAEVVRTINGLKANTPLDAVVMRRGRKETIKGLTLPEARRGERGGFPAGGGFGGFPGQPGGGFPGQPGAGGGGFGGAAGGGGFGGAAGGGGFGGAAGGFAGAGNGVMTTVFRTADHFTARHQEGNLVITVTGTVADGKAATKGITVQDGGTRDAYPSVEKVPEQYRDKVKNLVEMAEKGAVKVEIK